MGVCVCVWVCVGEDSVCVGVWVGEDSVGVGVWVCGWVGVGVRVCGYVLHVKICVGGLHVSKCGCVIVSVYGYVYDVSVCADV